MNDTKRNTNIGKNMKPRKPLVDAPDQHNDEYPGEQNVSTAEVENSFKNESVIDDVQENVPIETPGRVETGKTEAAEENPFVAVIDGFGEPPKVPQGAFDYLNAMMNASLGVVGIPDEWIKNMAEKEDGSMLSAGSLVIPSAEEIAAIENGGRLPTVSEPVKLVTLPNGLGPQPNGDYGIVIQIKEGYWAGIKSQAESDGVTPEEWVTERLAEYLSQWWFGQ